MTDKPATFIDPTSPDAARFSPGREQVEALKQNWLNDPCWHIEDTEGFEPYRAELKAFSDAQQRVWQAEQAHSLKRENDELQALSVRYGIPGNISLMGYIRALERRIAETEDRLSLLDGGRGGR